MTPQQLLEWRKRLGLDQKEAASALGLAYSTYRNYERGYRQDDTRGRRGTAAPIPKAVELACVSIALGVKSYPAA